MIPRLRPQTRLFSLSWFLGNYFLTAVVRNFVPWYLPVVALFGYLTVGLLFDEVLCLAAKLPAPDAGPGRLRHLPQMLRVFAFRLLAGQLTMTLCVARQLQVRQILIENGLRRPIGLWLHDHARTLHDTVMLEPLGYIGYYSGLKMLDFPGLASREMVETLKRLGPYQKNRIALELKPDWLVLRPMEIQAGKFIDMESLQKFYELAQVFDASDKIGATRWLLGRPYLQYDQTFLVFHRNPDAIVNPPDSGTGQ